MEEEEECEGRQSTALAEMEMWTRTGCTSLLNSITSFMLWTRSSWVSSAMSNPRVASTGKSVRPSSNCQGGGQ